jgi:hypothetical protein
MRRVMSDAIIAALRFLLKGRTDVRGRPSAVRPFDDVHNLGTIAITQLHTTNSIRLAFVIAELARD